MKPLDGYVRVSRVGGRNGERFLSPAEQETAIRQWAAAQGEQIGEVPHELDVSGAIGVPERAAAAADDRMLGRLIARVESGASAGVVTNHLDRFGRDMIGGALALKRITDAGGRLVCVADSFDSRDPGSQLVFNLRMAIAQDFLQRQRDGFARASASAVERGIHVGAHCPAGYSVTRLDDGGDGVLVVEPDTAPFIGEAFERRARGESYQRIADWLSDTGVQPGGSKNERWSRNGVWNLIRNRVYLGEVRGQRGVVNPKAHEPLVSPELFAAANRKGQRALRSGKLENAGLLAGLITCAACGHKLRRKASGNTTLYACAKHYASGTCPEPAAATIRLVDEYVIEQIASSQDPLLRAVDEAGQRHREAAEEVERAQTDLENYVESVSALDAELFKRGLEARQARLREAQQTLYENPPEPYLDIPVFDEQRRPTYDAFGRAWMRRYVKAASLRSARGKRGAAAPPMAERVRLRWVGGAS